RGDHRAGDVRPWRAAALFGRARRRRDAESAEHPRSGASRCLARQAGSGAREIARVAAQVGAHRYRCRCARGLGELIHSNNAGFIDMKCITLFNKARLPMMLAAALAALAAPAAAGPHKSTGTLSESTADFKDARVDPVGTVGEAARPADLMNTLRTAPLQGEQI